MSERVEQLLLFYREHRVDDQLRFYTARRALYDQAAGQAMGLSAILLGLTAAASALAGVQSLGHAPMWRLFATVLPAASTAVAGYATLYAFDQQSKIYADAVRAVRAAARPVQDATAAAAHSSQERAAGTVNRVEAALRREQAQWGQLTGDTEIPDETRA